jgi:hypothetical protein
VVKLLPNKILNAANQLPSILKNGKDGVYDICLKSNSAARETATAYMYWYKGDAVQKAKELLESVPKNPKHRKTIITRCFPK